MVDIDGKTVTCGGRKSVKFNSGNLLIGDYVEVTMKGDGDGMIEKIVPRKNFLVRPAVSNIDKIVILISSVPEPDFYLIDKMLVSASIMGIAPCIVVNKSDLNIGKLYDKVCFDYGGQVENIILISTFTGQNIEKVREVLQGSLTCLVGQSAVGKSSLVNSLKPSSNIETGVLSKNNRGKHTTRHLEIVELPNSTFLVDTPGFSFLDLDIDPKDLMLHYKDYVELSKECRFTRCVHINEPDCKVLTELEKGTISKERYDRYKELYNELLIKWRKKYG
ncbi:MAG: ribosome small subunit-dependent GTPase A [Clostridia bacterium]